MAFLFGQGSRLQVYSRNRHSARALPLDRIGSRQPAQPALPGMGSVLEFAGSVRLLPEPKFKIVARPARCGGTSIACLSFKMGRVSPL